MTCENVTVEYPSARLLPLLNVALEAQQTEKKLCENRIDGRNSDYKSLPWYKKIYKGRPDDLLGTNWEDRWYLSMYHDNISELNQVRLSAEVSDYIRISGACLARIDNWAGN